MTAYERLTSPSRPAGPRNSSSTETVDRSRAEERTPEDGREHLLSAPPPAAGRRVVLVLRHVGGGMMLSWLDLAASPPRGAGATSARPRARRTPSASGDGRRRNVQRRRRPSGAAGPAPARRGVRRAGPGPGRPSGTRPPTASRQPCRAPRPRPRRSSRRSTAGGTASSCGPPRRRSRSRRRARSRAPDRGRPAAGPGDAACEETRLDKRLTEGCRALTMTQKEERELHEVFRDRPQGRAPDLRQGPLPQDGAEVGPDRESTVRIQ